MRSTPVRLAAPLLAGALVLAACDGAQEQEVVPTPDPAPTAEPTPDDTATPTPDPETTPEPTPAPPEPDDPEDSLEPVAGDPSTEDREADPEAGTIAVTDVRVGAHEGFDRIVFETDGDGAPGWFIGYVPEARTQGRGDLVELEGDAVLSIGIWGATLPPELPPELQPVDFDRIDGPPGGVVTEVAADTIFEGIHGFFAGVTDEHPFVVERLEDPTRVVIDIIHGG